jgi:hypothetical protein
MANSSVRTFGSVALWLSLLLFAIYFLNVLFGGPLGHKQWMSDLAEMLTLFAAVVFFVAGAICREAEQSGNGTRKEPEGQG